jgi:16S rRNA (adenine1518-N6/adenine1519-N6)-dimethyltransferase
MTKRELIDVLAAIGVRPSRKLGQNFLIDPNMLDALVRDAAPRPGQTVLEVGPGTGTLTRRLLEAGCRVVAVELDARLHDYLSSELGAHPHLTLVRGDACRIDLETYVGTQPYRCIANLPYSSSSVFLAHVMNSANMPTDMALLLQREMADRLAAQPATSNYGALSVRVQIRYQVDIVRKVPPQVFFPAPEVESAYARLAGINPQLPKSRQLSVDKLTKCAFQQRRKKLLRTLAKVAPIDILTEAFETLEIPQNSRPEELTPDNFAALAACLESHSIPYLVNRIGPGDDR